ncbi:MAG: hypothetical protein ACE5JL_13880, partial [Dehalococcoidia bacterium]
QGSGSDLILDNEGQAWRVEESALVNVPNPQMRLKRLGGHAAYWFGWYAFHPETTVYRDEE